MPNPSSKCNTTWTHSVFTYDGSTKQTQDGIFDVYACDPKTGDFTGLHDNSKGTLSGTCQTTSPHITFKRTQKIGKKTYVFTYSGDIDNSGIRPIIVRGRIKKVEKVGPVKARNDDGDWTAQGPVTLNRKFKPARTSARATKAKPKR